MKVINRFIHNVDWAYFITVSTTLVSYIVIIPLMKRFLPCVTAQKDVFKV